MAVATSAPTTDAPVDTRAALRQRMTDLARQAEALGAIEGPRRLLLVEANLEKLAPQSAYAWLDPASLRLEIEDAQGRSRIGGIVTTLRNILSILPLILTWYALSAATSLYQQDIQLHPDDITVPFLKLWEDGFRGKTGLTFTVTGITDVCLLLGIVGLTIFAGYLEGRHHRGLIAFTGQLQAVTDEVVAEVASGGLIQVSPNASVSDVTDAVQRVIDRALAASKQVVDVALKGVETSNNQVSPLLRQFSQDMVTLEKELTTYQSRLAELTQSSTDLASAAKSLEQNAGSYTTVATAIQTQVASLDSTQQQLSKNIQGVATSVGMAAKSIESVAHQMTTGLKDDIAAMTANVTRAAATLRQVEIQLEATTRQLERAANNLATVRVMGGGLIGWLLNIRTHRSRRGEMENE